MAEASRTDVRRDLREVEIGRPVAERMRAAERNDRQGAGVVDGHVAGHACQDSTIQIERWTPLAARNKVIDMEVRSGLSEGWLACILTLQTRARCSRCRLLRGGTPRSHR